MSDIEDSEFAQAQLWNLPSVDDEQAKLDYRTNALNRPKNRWKFEAPEQEEEVKPITAQEIESIRAAAYQEGLLSGQTDGFEKGFKEGLEQGKEQGIKDGHAQGLVDGNAESKAQIDAQMHVLQSLINNVAEPTEQINKEVKNELLILATSLAKAVIKIDVQQNSSILIQAITEGIKTLPLNEVRYQISMHPDDINIVKNHFGDEYVKNAGWQLIESPALAQGGCHIHTASNAVDVSIERRSEQVFNQLLLNQGLIDDPRTR
jgi:flagellar assembly protein FliH